MDDEEHIYLILILGSLLGSSRWVCLLMLLTTRIVCTDDEEQLFASLFAMIDAVFES